MKVYVLVTTKNGEPTFDMPTTFGRGVRAYDSKARAQAYAKRFKAVVIELDLENGEEV